MASTRSKQRSFPGLDNENPPSQSTGQPLDEACTPRIGAAPAAAEERCAPQPQRVDIQGWNFWAVDAHSLIFQVFHALPEMSSPRGEQVGAVYGFTRDMLYLIEEKKPDALVCAFDLSGPTFRSALFDAYKAEHDKYMAELNQFCTARAIPYFRTHTRIPFDELILRIFRQGGFLR